MATEESASTVVGVFRSHEEAERAVNKLVASGFPAQDIGFLGPGEAKQPELKKAAAAGVGGGAVIGAIAGGLIGAASMLAVPGVGPILTAGVSLPQLVVGVQGSDNSAAALEWEIQFAHLTGAEIVAVFAISPASAVEYVGPAAFGPLPAVPPELDPALRSAATQEFEQEWCRKLRDSKAAHQMIVEEGSPA